MTTGLILGLVVAGIAWGVLQFLFLRHLRNLVESVSPKNRAMRPNHVWLNLLVPAFTVVTVVKVRESLRAEYRSRGMLTPKVFGYGVGLVYGILGVGGLFFGPVLGLPFQIIYWVITAKIGRELLDEERHRRRTLRVDRLSKSFGGLNVLGNVSFAVEPGEKLALIGPNGAGKTTLINIIGGQLPLSGGRVFLGERDMNRLSPNKRLGLGVGRSFQVNNLFFELSILDNVLLALYGAEKSHLQMFRRLEKRQDLRMEAKRLLDTVGLAEIRREPLQTQSYGNQRLVELLCAFACKPEIVLLDEPTAGLPTAEAAAFANIIRRLAGDTTILFCAHDMDLVFNLADQIMVLYSGEIIAKGTPGEISANPKVQEIYLGGEESC
jgi:branched-chain amino acid transport system ATP-binding protein